MTLQDAATQPPTPAFHSFAEFYPYYLSEHINDTSRRLHYIGSLLVLGILAVVLLTQSGWWLLALPVAGYGFAWVGHFFFEKNKPATFQYPLYSFMGDWVMLKDALTGRIRF
ncbi:Mpo1-like protein [Halopseudomonas pelagia]|uniref:Mpo1-like protein n=1 Tax=Halopseudomonas pelagia TaxID=553151 RepID=UPI00039E218C|nr:Mpo1-like protein [Halopseudomonas pelagia]|tara:strand:- start:365 stop:700 length:336 start_codon:yes stop_codon:yes gene_type:complete